MSQIEERKAKHQRVREYLQSHGLDAVLLSRRCNYSWFTCGGRNYVNTADEVGNSWLLVGREGAWVLTTNVEATRLRAEEFAGADVEVIEFPYFDEAARSAAFAKALAGRRVATDACPPWLSLPALESDFDRLRWTLTPQEVARYRALCRDAAAAVETAARQVRPGQTEDQAAGVLAGLVYSTGCLPCVLLVAGDERVVKFRHPLPTRQAIRRYFMLVVCAERDGLVAACTRLASFGRPGEDLVARHRAVATVDAAMILATRPGTTLGAVYDEGRRAYAAVGYPEEWRLHHQGGSCGYLPREIIAGPGMNVPVLADQAFAWNPSITGTKSEDTILCTAAGPEVLAGKTDWPTLEVQWQGKTIRRPAILETP
jgi:Xaa-Pro aminopeptidase